MRRAIIALVACMALPSGLVLPAEAGEGFKWCIKAADEIQRPDEPGAESFGGMIWVSNDVYWAVTDWRPVVWELTMPIDPSSGKFKGCSMRRLCRPEKAVDVEGIARDPFDGSIWIADERRGCINRYDSATGKQTGTVSLPPVMNDFYRDSGLESLNISSDGLFMWTCAEEALKPDGPRATRTKGTDIRLLRFGRKSAGEPWKMSGQWVYRTDTMAGGPWFNSKGKNLARVGISELCSLEDGTLLVLEREFSTVVIPRLRCRIDETDMSSATDV